MVNTLSHVLVAQLWDKDLLVKQIALHGGTAPDTFATPMMLMGSPKLEALDWEPEDPALRSTLKLHNAHPDHWRKTGYGADQIWTLRSFMIDCGPNRPPAEAITETGNGVRVRLVNYKRI